MSDPTLHDLMEDPTGWTEYSCECIVGMASDRIDELEAELEWVRENARTYRTQVLQAGDLLAEQERIMRYVYNSSSVLTEPAEDMLMAALGIEEEDR